MQLVEYFVKIQALAVMDSVGSVRKSYALKETPQLDLLGRAISSWCKAFCWTSWNLGGT
jgi:hypothetical protein